MHWIATCGLALLLVGPTGARAAWQDAPPAALDPAAIGAGWVLIEDGSAAPSVERPYEVYLAEYAGPRGERVLIDLAFVAPGPEHINQFAVMAADRAVEFGRRSDFLVGGEETVAPTDACDRDIWWAGGDPLIDDPAIVGMCSFGDGRIAVIVASGPDATIAETAGRVTELLGATDR